MIPKNKIKRIKGNITSECKECLGDGCHKCKVKCSRLDRYASSGIPVEYWMHSFKNFSGDKKFKKAILEEISDIDEFYDTGMSIGLYGNLGTGKTYTACCILKIAVLSGYSCMYTTMADVVNTILSSSSDTSQYFKSLMEQDFLVIDEFDSRWIFPSEKTEQIFGSSLEYILRARFQNQLPTIICSNNDDIDQILGGFFSKSFKSLRSKYMKTFCVGGKDFRRL
jgi:DNA replication protein DnaC|tara:strand:- start:8071 stop:8742 length:672 start_codon:yes stop_codon:yes gene_type:complete